MGATVYELSQISVQLKLSVQRIAPASLSPQHIQGLIHSFAVMQFTWEMLGQDTQLAFVSMIEDASKLLTQQVSEECSLILLLLTVTVIVRLASWLNLL